MTDIQKRIWPEPQEMHVNEGRFAIDEETILAVPAHPTEREMFLARLLSAELADRFGLGIPVAPVDALPQSAHAILIGATDNALLRPEAARLEEAFGRTAEAKRISPDYPWDPARDLPQEGYLLLARPDRIVVSGRDDAGALHGLHTLRQLLARDADGKVVVPSAAVRDWPHKPFRGIRLFLPGREHIAFFKRFLRDFMAPAKFNKIVIETNAAIRFDRHPELNAGWCELAGALNRSRRGRSAGYRDAFQDSVHHDTGDFGLLEKNEVADICRYARDLGIEVIPEIPSLTHAYYLLTRHREFAENADVEWPDTTCPLCEEVYDLVFDVMEETIEAMQPTTVHVGHDEWRMPIDRCPRCKGRDYPELFTQDINRIHRWLAARGIRMAIWCDHLLEAARGKGFRVKKGKDGEEIYRMPGALSPQMVEKSIPKDILIFNWFWCAGNGEGRGIQHEETFERWGFQHLYGNMMPRILSEGDYESRSSRQSLVGGAVSSWAASTPENFGKDLVYRYLGVAAALWSSRWPDEDTLSRRVQERMPQARRALLGEAPPSAAGDPITHVPIPDGDPVSAIPTGEVSVGDAKFQIGPRLLNAEVSSQIGKPSPTPPAIPIGRDVSSLIFLHACDKPAKNDFAFRRIYNFDDTADLLGWYEVEYEDGYIETVPIRYGVHLCETGWLAGREDPGKVCFLADPVDVATEGAEPLTLWAYEWRSPRWCKAIREVRLRATSGHLSWDEEPVADNRITLAALSVVEAATPDFVANESLDDA